MFDLSGKSLRILIMNIVEALMCCLFVVYNMNSSLLCLQLAGKAAMILKIQYNIVDICSF